MAFVAASREEGGLVMVLGLNICEGFSGKNIPKLETVLQKGLRLLNSKTKPITKEVSLVYS